MSVHVVHQPVEQSKLPTQEEKELDAKNGIVRYYRTKEYQKAMEEFTTFVTIGDNTHDDAVDGITQLMMFIDGDSLTRKARILENFM